MAASAANRPATLEVSPNGGPERPWLMIVEDDDDIRRALTEILEDRGFDVLGAANGREALDMLRGSVLPSMILLDLMMPVMDGWDFRQEQMNDPILREIPVAIFSASGFSQQAIKAKFGDVELLTKPVCIDDLYRVVDRLRSPTEAAA